MKSTRRFTTALAGLAGVAVTASLVLVAAPSASALLCGYPPKACPTGQVNPKTAATVAPGILLVSNSEATGAENTRRVVMGRRDASPMTASHVDVTTSDSFRGKLGGLAANQTVLVSILMKDGSAAAIGIVRTDRYGRTTLPAVRLSRPAPTTFLITLQNGDKRYITFIPQIG